MVLDRSSLTDERKPYEILAQRRREIYSCSNAVFTSRKDWQGSDEIFLVSLLRICLLVQVISPKSRDGLTPTEGWAGDVASLIQCIEVQVLLQYFELILLKNFGCKYMFCSKLMYSALKILKSYCGLS